MLIGTWGTIAAFYSREGGWERLGTKAKGKGDNQKESSSWAGTLAID